MLPPVLIASAAAASLDEATSVSSSSLRTVRRSPVRRPVAVSGAVGGLGHPHHLVEVPVLEHDERGHDLGGARHRPAHRGLARPQRAAVRSYERAGTRGDVRPRGCGHLAGRARDSCDAVGAEPRGERGCGCKGERAGEHDSGEQYAQRAKRGDARWMSRVDGGGCGDGAIGHRDGSPAYGTGFAGEPSRARRCHYGITGRIGSVRWANGAGVSRRAGNRRGEWSDREAGVRHDGVGCSQRGRFEWMGASSPLGWGSRTPLRHAGRHVDRLGAAAVVLRCGQRRRGHGVGHARDRAGCRHGAEVPAQGPSRHGRAGPGRGRGHRLRLPVRGVLRPFVRPGSVQPRRDR